MAILNPCNMRNFSAMLLKWLHGKMFLGNIKDLYNNVEVFENSLKTQNLIIAATICFSIFVQCAMLHG